MAVDGGAVRLGFYPQDESLQEQLLQRNLRAWLGIVFRDEPDRVAGLMRVPLSLLKDVGLYREILTYGPRVRDLAAQCEILRVVLQADSMVLIDFIEIYGSSATGLVQRLTLQDARSAGITLPEHLVSWGQALVGTVARELGQPVVPNYEALYAGQGVDVNRRARIMYETAVENFATLVLNQDVRAHLCNLVGMDRDRLLEASDRRYMGEGSAYGRLVAQERMHQVFLLHHGLVQS